MKLKMNLFHLLRPLGEPKSFKNFLQSNPGNQHVQQLNKIKDFYIDFVKNWPQKLDNLKNNQSITILDKTQEELVVFTETCAKNVKSLQSDPCKILNLLSFLNNMYDILYTLKQCFITNNDDKTLLSSFINGTLKNNITTTIISLNKIGKLYFQQNWSSFGEWNGETGRFTFRKRIDNITTNKKFFKLIGISTEEIKEIEFLYSVQTFRQNAFRDFVNLESIILSSPTQRANISVGIAAFLGCTSLQSIPSQITKFGRKAFKKCTNLKEISIAPEYIGNQCFYGCNLTRVTLDMTKFQTNPRQDGFAFGQNNLSPHDVIINASDEQLGNREFQEIVNLIFYDSGIRPYNLDDDLSPETFDATQRTNLENSDKTHEIFASKELFLPAPEEPLFPNGKLEITDIAQGFMENCWLLSAIASIVATQPEKIREIMHDNGDGTVTVKLFRTIDFNNKYLPGRPVEIKVNKSRAVKEDGRRAYNDKNDLWVTVLEKAFAVYFDGIKKEGILIEKDGTLENTLCAKAPSTLVYTAITGKLSNTINISPEDTSTSRSLKKLAIGQDYSPYALRIFNKILKRIQQNSPIGLGTDSQRIISPDEVLCPGHAFSLIGIIDNEGILLAKGLTSNIKSFYNNIINQKLCYAKLKSDIERRLEELNPTANGNDLNSLFKFKFIIVRDPHSDHYLYKNDSFKDGIGYRLYNDKLKKINLLILMV